MIALTSSRGDWIKTLTPTDGIYGYHPVFGFIMESKLVERLQRRRRHGIHAGASAGFLFRFQVQMPAIEKPLTGSQPGFMIQALDGCEAEFNAGAWGIRTPRGQYQLKLAGESPVPPGLVTNSAPDSERKMMLSALLLAFLFSMILLLLPRQAVLDAPTILPEPIKVTMVPEVQKQVHVPNAIAVPEVKDARLQDKQVKRAIQQNLGFLGLLGRKDLTKAMGGVPSQIKDASPGAGAGGKEGSGGEFLVGLGQGVKRATVGNTGVSGLGGVGTKGAGGGGGGYGNTLIGSGEGRSLSKVALSNDMVLEGGLDRAVIQATIAKYLSQVRACYEEQLQKNPGLAGQVTMAFSIGGGGDVASANVGRSTLGNAPTETCIASRLMTWKFPKPVGGVTVKVNYPFMLRPMGT